MLPSIRIIIFVFALISNIFAEDITLRSYIYKGTGSAEFWTCDDAVSTFVFDYVPLGLGPYEVYDAVCGYPPAVGTILICFLDLANDTSEKFQERLFKYASSQCSEYSSYKEPWTFYRDQYLNATKYLVPLDDITNLTLPIYSPTTPNMTAIEPEYIGYTNYYFNLDSGTWFSVGICGYFLLLIVISAIYNFSRMTSISKSLNNSMFVKLCQKNIIFPTLFPKGKYSQKYGFKFFSGLFPNRIQFITDLFLFALQMAFYCVSYRYNEGWWFGTPHNTWHRFLADRTGVMAFGKIPLLILFAGRNNFLLYITGWSYSTFLHFHKVTAYWMFLDAVIHSVAYTIYSLGDYVSDLHDTYYACGVAATVICGAILLQAFHPFRVFFYEYFLVIHVVFALAFIIMCWYHCNILGWLEWLIAACCAWFFDRLLRAIRMSAFGFRNATVYVAGKDLIKIEVAKPKWWRHRPGQYAYIYFGGWIFWENHPFTTVVEGDKICAYIRVKSGVTYRTWNKLVANNNRMECKVCLEGPYEGESSSKLKKYDEVLLLAGGSGIPSILDNASQVSRGKLVWVAQTLESIKAYKPLVENANVEIEVFITKEQGTNKRYTIEEFFNISETQSENTSTASSDKESSSDKEISAANSNNNDYISINYSKPNMFDVIDESVRNANVNNLGIMACGPPSMMDDIRNVVSENVTMWDKSIDFFDEFQIW